MAFYDGFVSGVSDFAGDVGTAVKDGATLGVTSSIENMLEAGGPAPERTVESDGRVRSEGGETYREGRPTEANTNKNILIGGVEFNKTAVFATGGILAALTLYKVLE